VIVFDASTLVSAAFRRDGIPARAFRHALGADRIAVSEPVIAELLEVVHRPALARFLDPALRAELLGQLLSLGAFFEPSERVTDCRDAKDDKYLELALAARAGVIVSSDADLLALDPWRGVRILRPAAYLGEATTRRS
jgi:uncharacterized protein